jgi:hypothetical protein
MATDRKFDGEDPEYIQGHYRKPPDNADWARRYLRRRLIECEGDDLQTALDSLDSAEWARMRAAWRKREERSGGGRAIAFNRDSNDYRFLGRIWRKLIAWGVISEENARLLAEGDRRNLLRFYCDAGARYVLSLALENMVQECQREKKRLRSYIASTLMLESKKAIDDTLDSRVIAFVSTPAPGYEMIAIPEPEARELLSALKESGHYARIIDDAKAKAEQQP